MAASILFLLLAIISSLGLARARSQGVGGGELGFAEEPPREVIVPRGKGVSLPCLPLAPLLTNVTWTHDGKPLSLREVKRNLLANGTLILRRSKKRKDWGVYRCIIQSEEGALISRPSRVTFANFAKEFHENPKNVEAQEGDVIRLSCALGSVPKAAIKWYRFQKPLPPHKRYVVTEPGVLYIFNIRPEDAGLYRCQASNHFYKRVCWSSESEVKVNEGHLGGRSLEFLEGSPPPSAVINTENGSIPCAATGSPRPTLTWIYSPLGGPNVSLQTSTTGFNLLKISNTNRHHHSGNYTCIASQVNREKVTIRKVVHVQIYSPPVITQKPLTQVYPAAKTARINCSVTGSPTPQVVWYKDGLRLKINGRIKQKPKELVLGGVVSQDTGVYQCFAGDVWGAGKLVVNTSSNQPLPPQNLSCLTLSPTQVQLSWRSSHNHTQLTPYSVHYFPTDGGEEGKEVTVNEMFDVNKLLPYTNYTFYIRSYNTESASEPSERVVCSTGQAKPIGGPQVRVTVESRSSVSVSWVPPPVVQARGEITEYRVLWKLLNQTSPYFVILPASITQFTITGLISGQEYYMRVIAATVQGWPELTDLQAPWATVILPQSDHNVISPRVSLSLFNSTTLQLKWSSENETFHLSLWKLPRQANLTFTLPQNISSFNINNLEPLSWYKMAFERKSGGEPVFEVFFTGNGTSWSGNVRRPLVLNALPLSPRSIRLNWEPVDNNTCFYSISVNALYNTTPALILSNTSSIDITSLKPNTIYEISVSSMESSGLMGRPSPSVQCKTFPLAFGTIGNIEWEQVEAGSVQVKWTPLETPVVEYIVYYSSDLAAPIGQWNEMIAPGNTSSAIISNLDLNTRYGVKVQWSSSSGKGPLSESLIFTVPSPFLEISSEDTPRPQQTLRSDQFLGVLVGSAISACCVILCSGTLLCKKHCSKGRREGRGSSRRAFTGPLPPSPPAHHELQALTHLDTKGGYPKGHVNGVKLSLSSNGDVPNGHIKNVRITEIPKFEGKKKEEGDGCLTDEADSLLSGPDTELEESHLTSFGQTLLTSLDQSGFESVRQSPARKGTPPDDGFHETNLLAPNG